MKPGVCKALGDDLRGKCLTARYPQAPGSPYQWPTDEPYSVIASKEFGLCETMLGKDYLSTLTSINGQAREMYR